MRISSHLLVLSSLLIASSRGAWAQNANAGHTFQSGDTNENRIAREVRHELVMLPYYSVFDDLAFQVQDTTITLLGDVVRPTLKSDAENVTKRVEGVTKVVNKINVLPLSPFDNQIRLAMARVIYGDPTISVRYSNRALPPIHIIVNNGHVTLEGVVANQGDKDLINVRANTVPNVFSVDNRLQVEKRS